MSKGISVFVCIVCWCWAMPLLAQDKNKGQSVRGVVVDQASKVPISYVKIELLNCAPIISTTTDDDGIFEMEGIPLGRQRLRVETLGYYPKVTNIEVNSGKEVILVIDLEEEYNAGQTTTAQTTQRDESTTKDTRRIRNERLEPLNEMNTVSYRSFSVEDVTRYPGALEDPARMITNFAGSFSVDDPQNYIVARGNSPFGIRWEIDGIPIDNPHHLARLGNTGAIFPIINTNVLGDSEFLSGAFAAEHGNATSGVIDLNTRKGNNQQMEYMAEVSLWGAEVGIEGPLKKGGASFIMSYRYSLVQFLRDLGVNTSSNSDPRYQDLNIKFDIPTAKAGHFSLFAIGGIADVSFLASNYLPSDVFATQNVDIFTNTQFGLGGLTHKKFLGEKSYLKTTLSYLFENYESDKDTLFGGGNTPYYQARSMRHRIGLSTTLNSKINPRFTTRMGAYGYGFLLDIEERDLLSNNLVYFSDDLLFHVGGFIQAKWKLSRRFFINFGVHSQYFSLNDRSWSVEPRLAFNWYLGRRHRLSLGYGWHTRLQPFSIWFHVQPDASESGYDDGNRDLGLLNSHHLVLSYDLNLHQQWVLRTNIYGQYNTNIPVEMTPSSFSLINYGVYETPQVVDLIDNGISVNVGAELSLEKFFSRGYYGSLAGSYFRSRYQGSDGIWRNTTFDVRHVVQCLVGKEFKIGPKKRNVIHLDLRVFHRGGMPYTPVLEDASQNMGVQIVDRANYNTLRMESYTRVDFKIGARFNPRRGKISHYFFVDIINAAMIQNDRYVYYNPLTQEVETSQQFGIIPNLFYRLQF